jgi:DNA polymerase III delta prime subunit
VSRNAFPGRRTILDQLLLMRDADKLGQPFLFAGPEGSGKENTALEFARLINCADPVKCDPEHRCESCAKALGFQHPDIHWIGPAPATVKEDEVRELLVKKIANPFHQSPWAATSQVGIGDSEHPGPMTIRSLIHFLRRLAFQSPYKVAVVSDSHRMNMASANAFLKTLEEPPPRTVIFMLSSSAEGMLPTILSRCQKIRFDPWPEAELVPLLQDQAGVDEETARQAARASDGNARRALAQLEPGAGIYLEWAVRLLNWIHHQDRAMSAIAADELHRGVISHTIETDSKSASSPEARPLKEAGARRERAIRLCELLNLLYSEAVSCRELGKQWNPRLAAASTTVSAASQIRSSDSLLKDLALIEGARREIDRNINIGLAMAVLFEGLIDHVERDQGTERTRAG